MGFDFPPLKQTKTYDRSNTIASRVFHYLRNAIVTMKLLPGDSLSEAEVAKRLEVSRQPVREAFIQLSKMGMLNIIPQRGSYIVKISRIDVENARFIREAVELAIVKRACTTADEDQIAEMQQLIDSQTKAAEKQDHERFLELDDSFHCTIALSADCLYAWHIVENLKAQMDRVRFLSLPKATPMKKIVEQHQQILGAIAAHDEEAAEKAIKIHLREILVILPKLEAEQKELFTEESIIQP